MLSRSVIDSCSIYYVHKITFDNSSRLVCEDRAVLFCPCYIRMVADIRLFVMIKNVIIGLYVIFKKVVSKFSIGIRAMGFDSLHGRRLTNNKLHYYGREKQVFRSL